MNQPTPGPTQVAHPWRATFRTGVVIVVGLLSLLPYVLAEANIPTEGAIGQAVTVALTVNRVLALPRVNALITEYLPWLAPAPRQP